MAKEMLINTVEGQECRIAILNDGRLEELYAERASAVSQVGNIYKGRVTNVEASIQAAFVDFGSGKNGFLHISDVCPRLFPGGKDKTELVGKKTGHKDRPPIQNCLKQGQELVVQIIKAGIGTKGPTMTTYLSIPGRLLVMMPGMTRLGVSRKIEDEEARRRARGILDELTIPKDIGFIVRTAGVDRSKRDIQRDLNYLLRLWKVTSERIKRAKAPAEIYRESDLVIRTIRDVCTSEIKRVVCDNDSVARRAKEFLNVAAWRSKHTVELYTGKEGLFHEYGLESEIEKIYARRVELPSGGSLVIDQTEALVAIDVNSGRFRRHNDAETTALKTNLEAAEEIVRQLRLRDLGGVIIIDFIDMRLEKNRSAVLRSMRNGLKHDKAKTKLLKISSIGVLEMTRQRIGPSLKSSSFSTCKFCNGSGLIKSEESQALSIIRQLERACNNDDVADIEVCATPPVAHHLNNYQRHQIARLETGAGRTIVIQGDDELSGDEVRITCTNARGTRVAWDVEKAQAKTGKDLQTVNIDDLPSATPSAGESIEPAYGQPLDEIPGETVTAKPKRSSRRRRSRTSVPRPADKAEEIPQAQDVETQVQDSPSASTETKPGGEIPGDQAPIKKKSRRRGKRGGKKHRRKSSSTVAAEPQQSAPADVAQPPKAQPKAVKAVKKSRRRSKTVRPTAKKVAGRPPTSDKADDPAGENSEGAGNTQP
ncbi:MAG: Rne/Rng family ribonuclease [Planctomycetes bacterium]|nr:Rne/Rng family ribonuclease [Planctomycetota bacterium]